MAKVIIPTPLRKFTSDTAIIDTRGGTVIETIEYLTEVHPNIKKHLLDGQGQLRSFVRIFVDSTDIKALDYEKTKVTPADTISIVPAIAGGSK